MLRMTKQKKRNFGIISFAPITAFILVFIYEYIETGTILAVNQDPAMINEICSCYNALLFMYGAATVFTFAVLIYFVIHIAKIKIMNAASKIIWIAVLAAFMPVSFPVFWHMKIRNEPLVVDTKSNIA